MNQQAIDVTVSRVNEMIEGCEYVIKDFATEKETKCLAIMIMGQLHDLLYDILLKEKYSTNKGMTND